MYVETSKQQQGSPGKNSHQKFFKMTNFDRFHRKYIINQYIGCIKKLNKSEIALRICKASQCTKFFIEIGF